MKPPQPPSPILGPVALVVALAPLASGCAGSSVASPASDDCASLCKKRLSDGADLTKGPCLSDGLPGGVIARDTVCDVAHNPRTDVDDDPSNQCAAFRDGRAHHFVEVTPTCEFIRAK